MKEEKILNEIYGFCEDCQSHECCPENDCVLYRIEQLIQNNKKTHQVEITETFQRVVEVEASNEIEAIFKVDEQYTDEKIVLDAADLIDYKIGIFESDANEE